MNRSPASLALVFLAGALLGCSDPAGGAPAAGDAAPPSRWALAAEPAGAVSVVVAQKAAPKDEVVVVGRVRDFVTGLAAFRMVDASVPYCGDPQRPKETADCETPWDYCCHEQEAADKQIVVVVSDASGAAAAGPLPELRNLDLVVVKGKLLKSASGDVELAATGWYRKERPRIAPSIKFPP